MRILSYSYTSIYVPIYSAYTFIFGACIYIFAYDCMHILVGMYINLYLTALCQAGQALFGVALLASGLNATLTGTLTGQIVMEGFTNWTISPIYRRIITRFLAIVPAIITISLGGEAMVNSLLIFTQVILSICLPFAVFPLVHVTGSKRLMGDFVNTWWMKVIAYFLAVFILVMNIILFINL